MLGILKKKVLNNNPVFDNIHVATQNYITHKRNNHTTTKRKSQYEAITVGIEYPKFEYFVQGAGQTD